MAANPADRSSASGVREQRQPRAIETLDRVAQASTTQPTVAYPNNGFALALRTVAGAIVARHRLAGVLGADRRLRHARGAGRDGGGAYGNLMGTLGDGLAAFYNDMRNQGLANDTTRDRVLRVRPPHLRKRQRGHRPRRGGRDDGARRLGARRTSRHRAARSRPAIRRSRTLAATCTTRPTSAPSTRGCSTTGSA